MAGRLRRFLNLERPRRDAPDGDDELSRAEVGARFGALERAHDREAGAATGAAADRFGPDRESGLQLAESPDGARPFQRCMRCGRDHGLYERACTGCGASLDTPEQRDFNDRLWAERQAEDARARAEQTAQSERAAREEAELQRMRREMGIELARQVGQRESARWGGAWGDGRPLAIALLSRVPEEWRLRVAVGTGVAWLVALGVSAARGSTGAIVVVVGIGIALLVPRGGTAPGGWDGL